MPVVQLVRWMMCQMLQSKYLLRHLRYNSTKATKWADIIMLQGESLLVPEAERDLQVRIARAIQTGLRHVAVVMCKSEVKTTAKMQMSRIYKDLPATMAFFESLEEAMDWVTEHGYRCERADVEAFFSESI